MNDLHQKKLGEIERKIAEKLGGLEEPAVAEALLKALHEAYELGESHNKEQMVYFNHLMRHLPDRIYFKDLKSRFIKGNDAFIQYFGVDTEQEVVGKTDFDFFPQVFAQQKFEDEQSIILEGKIVQKDEHDEQREGEVAWSSTTKMPLTDDEGKIIGTFGLSRDITDKKVAEQKLMALAKDLQEKNEQIESDLEMARKLQTAFIPVSYPTFKWDLSMEKSALTFSHRYIPSEKLAGDFFQVIPISNTKAGILICDVMGHGIRASLVTAILRGLVGELKLITPYPHVFLRKVNRSLNTVLTQLDITLFVTAFYGVIDLDRGQIHYANAGHPSPIIANRNNGTAAYFPPVADSPEPALGLIDSYKYSYHSVPIEPRNSLFFYTDGIVEVENRDGQEFGFERFLESFTNLNPELSKGVLDRLINRVDTFMEGVKPKDDMCIIRVNVESTLRDRG